MNNTIKDGEFYNISDIEYLSLFDLNETTSVKNIWQHLYDLVKPNINKEYQQALEVIFKHGTLSTRILQAISNDDSAKPIETVYMQLANCLQENKLFIPHL